MCGSPPLGSQPTRKMSDMTIVPKKAVYAVSRTDSHLQVVTPYHPPFISAAKSQLGAKWTGDSWNFELRDEAEALGLIEKFYGWKPGMAFVSVKVFFDEEKCVGRGPFVMLGRTLVSAEGRDSGARLGDGVRLHTGSVGSGGSMKNWLTVVDADTELVVHDVPEAMARSYAEGRRTKDGVRVEIQRTASVVDVAALAVERQDLLARIALVDKLLGTVVEAANASA